MTDLPTYGSLTHSSDGGNRFVDVIEHKLKAVLRALLAAVEVDENWYRSTYADVDEVMKAGRLLSAKQHYVAEGYFEDRMPRYIAVDERWYAKMNSDVAEEIEHGRVRSAQDHFETSGFREGRLPFEGWTL